MAVCDYCDQEMLRHVPCTLKKYDDFPDRKPRKRIAHEKDWGDCHDCGTPPGGLHHPGCDVERCPRCHVQAIACACTTMVNQ
jgi:hypothetical protein